MRLLLHAVFFKIKKLLSSFIYLLLFYFELDLNKCIKPINVVEKRFPLDVAGFLNWAGILKSFTSVAGFLNLPMTGFPKPFTNVEGFLKPFSNMTGFPNPPVAGFLNLQGVGMQH